MVKICFLTNGGDQLEHIQRLEKLTPDFEVSLTGFRAGALGGYRLCFFFLHCGIEVTACKRSETI